ncbi:MAG: hypothetical protein NZM03_12955 [Limisphaera sp.]|nr:hypothetical protein [Limisphaera sp.]
MAKTEAEVAAEKPRSWFSKKAHGGGSLLDDHGYGAMRGTWFRGGRRPIEVIAVVDEPPGLEVDEHSIVVARYPPRVIQVRGALGPVHRSPDHTAAAPVRVRHYRHRGPDQQLRLR